VFADGGGTARVLSWTGDHPLALFEAVREEALCKHCWPGGSI